MRDILPPRPSKGADDGRVSKSMEQAARLPTSSNAQHYVELRVGHLHCVPGVGYVYAKYVFQFEKDGTVELRKEIALRSCDGIEREKDGSHSGNQSKTARDLYNISAMAPLGHSSDSALKLLIESYVPKGEHVCEIYVGAVIGTAIVMELEMKMKRGGDRPMRLKEEALADASAFFESCVQVCKVWTGPTRR
ncbi:hypothetical protein T492DRAFT_1065651 [Pavlovales sp. CCMP2436]|nr:hypothetical protein T492DRAFT_1065651 [Pavlovales sp. CCMP2436]